jgi:hypothetical protein
MMGTEDRRKADRNQECSCPGRRDFLASLGHLGGAAVAVNLGLFRWSTRSVLGAPRLPGEQGAKPLIRVAFCQAGPDDILQAGWPGLAYDDDASQALYTRTLERAAAELGVALDVRKERLGGHDAADVFLSETLERNADGIVLTNMDGHVYGIQAVHRILDQRGVRDLPVLVFVPHGTLHANPGVYQRFREAPHCFVGATAEVDWLAQGLRMLKARWQMAHSRLAVVTGDVEREETLDPLGTVLHYVPIQTYVDLYEGTGYSEEVRGIAELYEEMSRDILEPSRDDLRQAARAYVASRRLLDETGCHGVTMDCFPHVAKRRLPHIFPPCLAFMQLLDEGSTGGCEADVFPALTELLSSYLLGRPGFLHNPIYDTVRNIYAGAHCKAPTRMAGFDEDPEPYVIRTHHEADFGAVPQVLFTENQPATLWRFLSPDALMIATGTILRNVDSHPEDGIGGCRCAFEMALDDVRDVRDVRGHHKILTYGKHLHTVRAWAQLAGVRVEHITGGTVA